MPLLQLGEVVLVIAVVVGAVLVVAELDRHRTPLRRTAWSVRQAPAGSIEAFAGWLHDADVELAQLLRGDRAGRVHHQILGLLVHREEHDLADIRLAGEQHDDAVDARAPSRHAAARRT